VPHREGSDDKCAGGVQELIDRALARLGAVGDVAAGSDELVARVERAKRNRETVVGSAHARGGAPPSSPGP
jgi:hypothetical protein